MYPILPDINVSKSQCLPAAVACLFNDASILKKPAARPKKYGHLFTDLRHFIDHETFEIIYASDYALNEDEFIELIYDEIPEYHLIPAFVAENNHVFLILFDAWEFTVYHYDLTKKTCSDSPVDVFLEAYSIVRLAVLVSPDDNSMLSIDIEELPHLIKYAE